MRQEGDFFWRLRRVEKLILAGYVLFATAVGFARFGPPTWALVLVALLPLLLLGGAWVQRRRLDAQQWRTNGGLDLRVDATGLTVATHLLPMMGWQAQARAQGGLVHLPWAQMEAVHVSDQILSIRPGQAPVARRSDWLRLSDKERPMWTYFQAKADAAQVWGQGACAIEVQELDAHAVAFWKAVARHQAVAFWKGCVPGAFAHLSTDGHAILDPRSLALEVAPRSSRSGPHSPSLGTVDEADAGPHPNPAAPSGADASPTRPAPTAWAKRGLRVPFDFWQDSASAGVAIVALFALPYMLLADAWDYRLPGGPWLWLGLPTLLATLVSVFHARHSLGAYHQQQRLDLAVDAKGLRVADHLVQEAGSWRAAMTAGEGILTLPWRHIAHATLDDPTLSTPRGPTGQSQWCLCLRVDDGQGPAKALRINLSPLGNQVGGFLAAFATHHPLEGGTRPQDMLPESQPTPEHRPQGLPQASD